MSLELHLLIKSLSKGEKRAIVLTAEKTDGDKNFLDLYYAISAQDEYDEDKLIEVNKEKPFIKHLGFTKNYLQNFILKQLRGINSEYKSSIRLKNFLIDIELMFWKGQFKMAIKLINQAKLIAEKYEYQLVLEELYYWERRIITSGSMKVPKILNYSKDVRFKIMDSYFTSLEYKKIINDVTAIMRESDEVRDESDLKKLNEILNHELLSDISKTKSIKATYDFYVLKASLHRLIGDFDTSIRYHKELQKFIKENQHIFIEENPIFYLGAANNIMLNALQCNDQQLFDKVFNTVTNMKFKEEYSNVYYNSRILIFILYSAINSKKYSSVKHLVLPENIVVTDLMTDVVKLLIHYYCVVINFHCGEFKESLHFINKIINYQKLIRVDVVGSTLLFNILVHFEMGHYDYLESIAINHMNFLKKHRLLCLYDSIFIKEISKINSSTSKKEMHKRLVDLKSHMESIKNKKTFHFEIDLIEWLDYKIKQQSH